MQCKDCKIRMEPGEIGLEESGIKVKGLICPQWLKTKFDKKIVNGALKEYRHYLKSMELHLKLKRKITQLAGGKKGIYLPEDLVSSVHIKRNESVYLYPIDKKTIVMERI